MSTSRSLQKVSRLGRGRTGLIITIIAALGLIAMKDAPADSKTPQRAGTMINPHETRAVMIRDKSERKVKLTMLVEHNRRFKQALQGLLKNDATPIFLSVSVLPHQVARFDPAALIFTQHSKTWQPDAKDMEAAIMPLDGAKGFGGIIKSGEVQQAFVLLPAWFSAEEPIYVNYSEAEFASVSSPR